MSPFDYDYRNATRPRLSGLVKLLLVVSALTGLAAAGYLRMPSTFAGGESSPVAVLDTTPPGPERSRLVDEMSELER